jgi:hypothetical protein
MVVDLNSQRVIQYIPFDVGFYDRVEEPDWVNNINIDIPLIGSNSSVEIFYMTPYYTQDDLSGSVEMLIDGVVVAQMYPYLNDAGSETGASVKSQAVLIGKASGKSGSINVVIRAKANVNGGFIEIYGSNTTSNTNAFIFKEIGA